MQCKDSQEHIVRPPLEKPWPETASLDGTLKHTRSILVFWMRKQTVREGKGLAQALPASQGPKGDRNWGGLIPSPSVFHHAHCGENTEESKKEERKKKSQFQKSPLLKF